MYRVSRISNAIRSFAEQVIIWAMRRQISRANERENEVLKKALIPHFPLACKRITPSDDYIQAFNKPHVHLIQDPIDSFTENGIATSNGKNIGLDVIILATGFDVLQSFQSVYAVGKMGKGSKFAQQAYLGICRPGFPNSFRLLGLGSGISHSSIIFMIECQVNYIIDCVRKLQESGGKSMTVKKSVHEDFVAWLDENMKKRIFGSACVTWYHNSMGMNTALWPKDLTTYWRRTYSCDMHDYEFE